LSERAVYGPPRDCGVVVIEWPDSNVVHKVAILNFWVFTRVTKKKTLLATREYSWAACTRRGSGAACKSPSLPYFLDDALRAAKLIGDLFGTYTSLHLRNYIIALAI
jgi:hypothetical protein